mmetsp:Transcript_7297/g.19045  ORF Transcript_7297/g.19045 Transcript_7297/m.19045 type:complete len:343 (-) Transcript_7297:309-1337(-)
MDALPNFIMFGAVTAKDATVQCVTADNASSCVVPGMDSFRPAVWLHEKTGKAAETHWIREYVKLFPPFPDGPKVFYENTPPSAGEDAVCYNSVVTVGRAVVPYSMIDEVYEPWKRHKILKSPRSSCEVTVTILNRDGEIVKGGVRQGRAFSDVERVRKSILKEGPKLGFKVGEVPEVKFDGLSFREQVDTMQGTDFLFAVHGAELTNIVFMRPLSAVVEVIPFGYNAELFQQMSHVVNIMHVIIVADPDTPRLAECLRKYNGKEDPGSQTFKDEFERMEKTFYEYREQNKTWHVIMSLNDKKISNIAGMSRPCLRAQMLSIDTDNAARRGFSMLDIPRKCKT